MPRTHKGAASGFRYALRRTRREIIGGRRSLARHAPPRVATAGNAGRHAPRRQLRPQHDTAPTGDILAHEKRRLADSAMRCARGGAR